MKKILSFFMFFILFAIWTLNYSMADFSWTKNDDMNMIDDLLLVNHIDHETMSNCEEVNHDCCISPFNDSTYFKSIVFNNESKKIKIYDFDFLSLLNSKLENSFLDKVNSPPKNTSENLSIKNNYTNLVWIIKNNC